MGITPNGIMIHRSFFQLVLNQNSTGAENRNPTVARASAPKRSLREANFSIGGNGKPTDPAGPRAPEAAGALP